MEPAIKKLFVKVESIDVKRGEYITVYLDKGTSVERDSIQVELRVTPNGIAEIFCDGLELKSFNEWRSAE